MLTFIGNILSLLKDYTSADESSLLYYDGYSVIKLANAGNSHILPETLISLNELLHVVKEDDPTSTIQHSISTEIEINKNFIHHYQKITASSKNKNFFLLIAFSGSENKHTVPGYLINYFDNQIKSIGALIDNYYSSDYSALASLRLIEMGNWKNILQQLNEISGDIVFILNYEGSFLSVNNYGAKMLDYTSEEFTGKHLTDFIDLDTINYTNAELSKIIEVRGTGKFEVVFLTKFDKKVFVELSVRTVISEGRIIGLLGVGRNITILKQLETKLHQLEPRLIESERLIKVERARSNQHKALLDELNRMKSEFVSNISHELRTPLASIVGFSETINSDPKMPDELRLEFNSIILNEGKRLAKLINDVLDLSRIEAGTIPLNKTVFDVVEITTNICEEYKKIAESKNIIFNTEFVTEKIMIEADRERIGQSIQALLDNAIKFTNPEGRIRVIISNLYREVEIIITDTGIGIPDKDLPFIFQKFHKLSRHESDIISTGIGLVFVKQIVDLHRGLVTVQSEPQRGTTIILKLLKSNREKKK